MVIVLIVIINIIILIGICSYTIDITDIDYSRYIKFGNVTELNRKGYEIQPQNVKFKFINPKGKQGTEQNILEINKRLYNKELSREIHEPKDIDLSDLRPPLQEEIDNYIKANATIVALVRNAEAFKIAKSIRGFEKSFNKKFRYPYTFINDQPFTEKFKMRIAKETKAPINYVVIPSSLWDKPEFIDETRESQAMDYLHKENVAYAKLGSYHNMCRFYLGNIFKLAELQSYRYYWRLEPSVEFFNDINYDVFKYLEKTGKIYGFSINLYDIELTVETLWSETLKFLNQGDNYKYINENGSFQWLLENQQNPEKNIKTGGYSTCHFWSNFEIGDMNFFRSEAYSKWFEYLDATGKFYYERWGDAPVHSMGLALFASKEKIHWFRDIGYFHDPYQNCPNSKTTKRCKVGEFSRWGNLADQNCMASWIDYSIDDPSAIY